MKSSTYETHTLSNGLRVICLPADSPVVYCGYALAAGTRHERSGEEGLAHFVEHTTFKGTQRRRASQISAGLERVGGDLNAFTQKETTTYYAALLKEHLPKAVDLLTDIVFHSTYPDDELEREKEVVCDEIESYNDSPAELIFDDFENLIFAGHPLGHSILGTAESVRRFSPTDAQRFVGERYRPENAVFFAYGDIRFSRLVRLLERQFEKYPLSSKNANFIDKTPAIEVLSTAAGTTITRERGTHQAHVMMGCHAYDVHHALRIPLYLLNNILGGPGMSSRLNVALRERRGLVYTVDSSMVCYGDAGMWAIYFGCDPSDVQRCLKQVRRELERLMEKPLSEALLRAAKRQLKGQIGVGCDNHEQFALDFGRGFLHHSGENSIETLCRKVDEVTAEQLLSVARELFDDRRLTTLIYK